MKKRFPIIYAFIDSQNLNLGTNKDLFNKKGKKIYKGWRLDFKKFRIYLTDKFRVSKAFLFIGYIKEQSKMYQQLQSCGYKLIFKPTTKDNLGKPKGNIDAELVLYSAAIEYNNYDKAVIVSGDGDFCCLDGDFFIGSLARRSRRPEGVAQARNKVLERSERFLYYFCEGKRYLFFVKIRGFEVAKAIPLPLRLHPLPRSEKLNLLICQTLWYLRFS